MDKSTHLDQWRTLWSKVLTLPTEHGANWDRFARESFELVRAALIYQRNALEMYEDTPPLLHGRLRDPKSHTVAPLPWPEDQEPVFSKVMLAPRPILGGMFVASASFRLPVAVLKAVELSADPFEEHKLLKRDGDWNREELCRAFEDAKGKGKGARRLGVKGLGCCNGPQLGEDSLGRLRNAIAIIVVHRDDFGHGEVGQPATSDYKRQREGALDSLYVCRILEAQRCRWTLDRLTAKR
jgi:hypothetical protein